jgi:hypothetical protein
MMSRHTEIRRPPRRHNLPVSDALEQNRLVAGARRVGKRAHGLGRLVGVGRQQVVEALVAERGEEPFAGLLVSIAPKCIKSGGAWVGEKRTCTARAVR